ncbi:uncharacterized protein LOC134531458 [Bacillus rossius redtenbacheri]|uniref:uncharacterized protein LOC134531458 n=1 Tax=Bacillus rossius redtenbacheri TaxID=93214 RepID=UPI002FDE1372
MEAVVRRVLLLALASRAVAAQVASSDDLLRAMRNPCSDDSDCYWLLDSRCSTGLCKCDEGLAPDYSSGSSASCVRLAVYAGERCSTDAKCRGLGDNARCLPDATGQGHCLCDANHHFLQGRCWRSVGLGGRCTGDVDCYLKRDAHRVACVNSTCSCIPAGWFFPSEDRLSCVDSASGVAVTVSLLLVGVAAALWR